MALPSPRTFELSVTLHSLDSKDMPVDRNPLLHQSGPLSSRNNTVVGSSHSVHPGISTSSTTQIASSSSGKAGPSNYASTVSKPTSSRKTSTTKTSKPEDVRCACNLPVVLKTVVRETASKGRQFWSCSNRDGCGFFDWADEGATSNSGTLTTSVPAKRPYSTVSWSFVLKLHIIHKSIQTQDASEDRAVRMCKCNEEGVLHTVLKESANKGRKFWSCRKSEHRCAFFEWDDEPPRTTPALGGTTSRAGSLNTNDGPGECFKV